MKGRKLKRTFGTILLLFVLMIGGVLVYVKYMLPDVGPAPVLNIKVTPALIKRGNYLANHVTVCIDCHSTRDYSIFSGPIQDGSNGGGGEKFDQRFGFPGVFYAKNITPYALGKWTDGEIFRAITAGVNKEGKALFPVMPYHCYGELQNEDVYAIIAYIRTLPSIEKNIPASVPDFPMNFIINTIPAKGKPMTAIHGNPLAYGKYLTTIAGCGECHTKKADGKVAGPEFGGGFEFHLADGNILRSTNITPDNATGIGNWTEDYFVQRFKSYTDSAARHKAVAKGEYNTVMPWIMYSDMDSSDLKAIYTYLRSVKSANNIVERFTAMK